jgi:dienelactone hydrolase
MLRTTLLCLGALALATEPAAAQPFQVRTANSSFLSEGKKIRLECFYPKGKKSCPTIVLVHDSAGLGPLPGTIFRQCSDLFARKGYVVLLVHYFDATGQTGLTPEEARKSQKHWPVWKNTIRDAVKHAAQAPEVDPDRIGLLGFSLGAYLSLAVAVEQDLKIAAVAEFFGGLPEMLWKDAATLPLPPTLIVHGLQDQVVPVKEAQALQRLLSQRMIPHECKLYDCGHLFLGTQLKWKKSGTPGKLMDIDGEIGHARDLTLQFFGRHLMDQPMALPKKNEPKELP